KCGNADRAIAFWHHHAHHLYNIGDAKIYKAGHQMRDHMRECAVLSFAESAVAAKKYAQNYCREKGRKNAHIELWNVKEGHTSSVWKLTISTEKESEVFAVNVAKDREAGRELRESSIKLRRITDEIPGINCAKVYDIAAIKDKMLPVPVVVTRNEWIDNACEIHS